MVKIPESPLILIDDERHNGWMRQSNWDCDLRGAGGESCQKSDGRQVLSCNTDYPTCLKRDINRQTDGTLVLETDLTVKSGSGFYIGFWGKETEAVKLVFENGFFTVAGKTLFAFPYGTHHFLFTADIDKGIAKVHADGVWKADIPFTGNAACIDSFRTGFAKEAVGEALLGLNFKLSKNYLVFDLCVSAVESALPAEYELYTETGKAKAVYRRYTPKTLYHVYDLTAQKETDAGVVRHFDRASGTVSFEIKYLPPEKNAAVKISLLAANRTVITLTDDGEYVNVGEQKLYHHCQNVWQTLNIEADTASQTALISLNGKKITTLAFENLTEFVDAFSIALHAQKKASVLFADMVVFVKPPYPADYVPEPLVPEKKGDYYVGINVCPIWHGGHHYGWDEITPFQENRPYLGFYDEGIPEVADWEIKWMCEHGIDFELYCWYAGQADAPMVRSSWSSAIHNGHMKARYSDKVKIALLWEASASAHPQSLDDFKKYFVPYFLEYFFKDSRYMTIDGYAIMSIYSPWTLIQNFGSAEKVREALEYLRSEVRGLGYKDLVIMCCSENVPNTKLCGVDAVHAYNWGRKGYDPDATKEYVREDVKAGYVHCVPTVSMGYNVVAWNMGRFPCMKPDDMKMLLEWCRDEILPLYKDEKESWKRKLVMLSTWNEYGEGTYLMPAGIHGFGYLDAVRSAFCKDVPHADTAPNKEQLKRLDVMHPMDRKILLPLEQIPMPETGKVYRRFTFQSKEDFDKWEFHGFSKVEIKDGRLVGHSDKPDPYMVLKEAYLPIDAAKVSLIRVHIRANKAGHRGCCIQAYYSVTPDKKLYDSSLYELTDPNHVTALDLKVGNNKQAPWKDQVTAFRFDPIWGEGDFELVDIEFVAAPAHKTLFIDGKTIILAQYMQELDGKTYLPFDTRSDLVHIPNLYYEWHETERSLYLFGVKNAVLTENSDTAVVDGRSVPLERPMTLYDGMPLIETEFFADILGFSYRKDQTGVYMTSKNIQ